MEHKRENQQEVVEQNELSYILSNIVNILLSNTNSFSKQLDLFVRKFDFRCVNSQYLITVDAGIAKTDHVGIGYFVGSLGTAILGSRFLWSVINFFSHLFTSDKPTIIGKRRVRRVKVNDCSDITKATFINEKILLTENDLNNRLKKLKDNQRTEKESTLSKFNKEMSSLKTRIGKLQDYYNNVDNQSIRLHVIDEIEKLKSEFRKKQDELNRIRIPITEWLNITFRDGYINIIISEKGDMTKQGFIITLSKLYMHLKDEETLIVKAKTDRNDLIRVDCTLRRINEKCLVEFSLSGNMNRELLSNLILLIDHHYSSNTKDGRESCDGI